MCPIRELDPATLARWVVLLWCVCMCEPGRPEMFVGDERAVKQCLRPSGTTSTVLFSRCSAFLQDPCQRYPAHRPRGLWSRSLGHQAKLRPGRAGGVGGVDKAVWDAVTKAWQWCTPSHVHQEANLGRRLQVPIKFI